MRPALHASFLRNRVIYQKRRKRTHVFSPRRLLCMVVCGVLLFIPGLSLTIMGLQNSEADYHKMDEVRKIMYQAVGPVMGILGIALMFASCIYFNCYGTAPQSSAPLTSQQSFSDQDQDEKGSIRSKQRDVSQQHNQQIYSQHHNGRSVDVHTPDSDGRRSIKEEDGTRTSKNHPHRTLGTTEEDVPLATMEDTTVLTKGQ